MLHSESFISCLDYLLEYSTGEFQALQLIVPVVFGVVDHLPPVCRFTFWKFSLKWVCQFDIMENNFFIALVIFPHIYRSALQYDSDLFSFTLFLRFQYCFIFYIVLWYSHFT